MDLAIQQMDKIPTASYDYSYEYCHSRLLAPEAQLYFHVHRHLQALQLTRQGLYQLSYTDVCGPACSQCQPWSAGNDMAYTLQTCTVYAALEW